jgi:hypothetical protein
MSHPIHSGQIRLHGFIFAFDAQPAVTCVVPHSKFLPFFNFEGAGCVLCGFAHDDFTRIGRTYVALLTTGMFRVLLSDIELTRQASSVRARSCLTIGAFSGLRGYSKVQ